MAAHRYWAVKLHKGTDSTYVACAELEMRESIGGADVTGSGTAVCLQQHPTYTVAKLFDGLYTNADIMLGYVAPTSGSYPQYGAFITYDFGSGNDKDIVEIAYSMPTSYGGVWASSSYCPGAISLFYSDDGNTWTLLWSIGANDMPTWAVNTTYAFSATAWDGTNSITRLHPPNGYRLYEQYYDTYPTNVIQYNSSRGKGPGAIRSTNRGFLPGLRAFIHGPLQGTGHIAGSTTSLGSPIPRVVYLIDQHSGAVLERADTHYPTNCEYIFENLDMSRTYTVLGVDRSTSQNDVVYAHVSPVE